MNTSTTMLWYGCRRSMAEAIEAESTAFARAIKYFGPIRAYFSKKRNCWTLDQKRTIPPLILIEFASDWDFSLIELKRNAPDPLRTEGAKGQRET